MTEPPEELRATFPTVFRGEAVTVDIVATMEPGRVGVVVNFLRDGASVDFGPISREELAALCREAARVKRE
jgi:hypothetical protein